MYPERLWGHSASYAMDTRGFFPDREADHSPPASAEVKNAWSSTSTPHGVMLS
jgi:hypothetical protein